MTFKRVRPNRAAGVAALAALSSLLFSPLAANAETPAVHAQAPAATSLAPTQFSAPLVDASGVLSDAEFAEIEDALTQFKIDHQKSMFIVYMPSFSGQDPQAWAEQAVQANGGGNTMVLAIATDDRLFDMAATQEGYWSEQELDDVYNAVYGELVNSDWAGAGLAAVEGAEASGSISGGNAAWVGAAGVGVVAAGGGIWAANRRRKKKDSAENLATARELDPGDTQSLERLPIATLATRAEEVIVSTDESVRRAREELNLAISEFGPERTRPFNRAMNEANGALQRAYQTQAELNDSIPETEAQQRAMYTDIISSAGQAEQALDEQAETFQELRNLLINAEPKLDELTQRSVDLRARLEPAKLTMTDLKESYSPEVLVSIDDNVEMAEVALSEAEKHISTGRDLAQRPAGQQGGLVEEIREAERATELADQLLAGVEHAEANIAAARNNLDALIKEVAEEIQEAAELKASGSSKGVTADWNNLEAAAEEAARVLAQAQADAQLNPLGAYTSLMDVDTQLDEQLDAVRAETADQDRLLRMLDQQVQASAAQIQAAEDLISTRGRVIDAQARTYLAQAQQLNARAMHLRTTQTREAITAARQASQAAQRASGRAQADIRAYQNRVNAQRASDGMGNLVTGLVLGQLLGGGGGGGFRGGFGGGGGGGFGGGGGGFNHRGGSF